MPGVPCYGAQAGSARGQPLHPGEDFSASMRNATLGLAAAAAVALVAADATIFGIEAWKVVLGVIGLALFRSASRESRTPSS